MNSAVLGGVITTPPQLRYTPDNKPVCDFELAFTNPSKSESTKHIKCVGFGKMADAIAQLHEGENIVLVGSINIIKQQVNGNNIIVIEFKINSFDIVLIPVNVNSVTIAGRTGGDTELKYFESGSNKATNSLAVRRFSETDWFNLEAWGKVAETMGNYVKKGGLIGISGRLKLEEWTDRNSGDLRKKAVIEVGQLDLLGKKEEEQQRF